MDLSEMSLKDLQKHEKDVHQAITDYEARRLKTARDACAALAKEHGFTLDEIVGNKSKTQLSTVTPPILRRLGLAKAANLTGLTTPLRVVMISRPF